jgi:outer membrane biosynthesis protein TonB
VQIDRSLRPTPTWRLPVLVGVLSALGVWLAIWLLHEPDAPVNAPKLVVPKIRRVHRPATTAAETGVSDAPEGEAPAEEAPTLPVGTSDLPEQLDRHQLEEGMEKARHAVEKCQPLEGFVGTITVHVTIAKTGNPQSTQLVAPKEKTATTDCVVKAVQRNASFPKFRGTVLPTTELTYPFLFREDGHLF